MLNRPTKETSPQDWFLFAEDRLKSADSLWKNDGLTMTGIETLQEAVERYLKGYLIARGWSLERTHDLETLVTEAESFDPQFGQFHDFAIALTADFFAQHYPGGDMTSVGVDYEESRKQTGNLVALIQQSLPHYFPHPPTK